MNVSETGSTKSVGDALVASAKARAGVQGYVTNLDDVAAETVIDTYHRLFNVEASFQMAKTALRARVSPVIEKLVVKLS